jgi:hypothetical protein
MRISDTGRSRYRSTWLDRCLADSRTVSIVGPIPDLDEARMWTVLQAAAEVPKSRITLVPDGSSRRWRYHKPLLASVVNRPDIDTSDAGNALTSILNRPVREFPLEVIVSGQYVVIDYSHGLGDGWLGELLTRSLVHGDPSAATAIAKSLPSHALWVAAFRSVLSRPAAIRAVFRLRRSTNTHGGDAIDDGRVSTWRSSMRCVTRSIDAQQTAALKAWAAEHAPGSTSNSVSTALWMAALRSCGADVDQRVMMLMNCRRYLPTKYQDANGNFALAIPLELPASAPGIAARVREAAASGLPLAFLAAAEARARITRHTESGQTSAVFSKRLRLAVSDLGRLTRYESINFDEDGRFPEVTAFVDTDGPDSVALIITEIKGVRMFTASFSTEAIEPKLIETALDRMCADPVGVLRGTVDET